MREKRQIFHSEEFKIIQVDNPTSRKYSITPQWSDSLYTVTSFQRVQCWEDLEGACGEGGGRGDRDGEHM